MKNPLEDMATENIMRMVTAGIYTLLERRENLKRVYKEFAADEPQEVPDNEMMAVYWNGIVIGVRAHSLIVRDMLNGEDPAMKEEKYIAVLMKLIAEEAEVYGARN